MVTVTPVEGAALPHAEEYSGRQVACLTSLQNHDGRACQVRVSLKHMVVESGGAVKRGYLAHQLKQFATWGGRSVLSTNQMGSVVVLGSVVVCLRCVAFGLLCCVFLGDWFVVCGDHTLQVMARWYVLVYLQEPLPLASGRSQL